MPHPILRNVAIALAAISLSSFFAITCLWFLASQPLGSQGNLYYLMWRAGLRPYDSIVARAGMYHDHGFRDSLAGISIEQFERIFPNTFYEVQVLPPSAKPRQRYFIDDYQQSRSPNGHFGPVWLAVFEDGRLLALDYSKG